MPVYSVRLMPHAFRQLSKLPRDMQKRVAAVIGGLSADPRPPGVKLLAGGPERWRIRVGVYRVVYTIEDDRLVVLVIKLGHRRDVYRGL